MLDRSDQRNFNKTQEAVRVDAKAVEILRKVCYLGRIEGIRAVATCGGEGRFAGVFARCRSAGGVVYSMRQESQTVCDRSGMSKWNAQGLLSATGSMDGGTWRVGRGR